MSRSRARRAVLALLALTPLLAACNAILGISDYEKTDCAGGVCDGGSSSSGGPDAGDSGADVGTTPVEAGGSDPVSWAKFVMPNYYQDGAVPEATVPEYIPVIDSDAGAFKDSVSQRVWRPVPSTEDKEYTFAEASKVCTSATGGKWRLPTRIELVTLLDFSRPTTEATAASVFNLKRFKYWTTSFLREPLPNGDSKQTTRRLLVGFDGQAGNVVSAQDEGLAARAICIRAQ